MKVAISAIRTKDIRLNRSELIETLQKANHQVYYLGQESEDKLHSDYEKYNVEFLSIPLKRINVNPFNELNLVYKTMKTLKKNNIEAIIIYGIRTFPAIVLAAKMAGISKILCIVNGSGRLFTLKDFKGKLIKTLSYPMLRLAFYLSEHTFFQNLDDLKLIKSKKLLIKENYSVINGSGVNLEAFKLAPLENKPVFSMISRITASKGVMEYIKAAKIVKEKYPDTTFNLVGPLDDSTVDINKVKKAADNGDIILKGRVEDVQPIIKKTRIFVLPSYYPEGIPRVILEAMAMGRPIITTDMPGCRETVNDHENGFLVQPRNINDLIKKMIYMIENYEKTNNMGMQSRKIAELKFDVNKINNKMLSEINLL